MDTSRLAAGEPALLSVRNEIVEVSSNTDSGEEEVAQLSRPLTDEERGKGAEKPQTVAAMTIEDDDDSEVEWEEESIMDDVIEELSDDDLRAGGPGFCTLEEAHYYRRLLRSIGPAKFISETIEADKITAKKLLTAFGIRPPGFLDGLEDENYYSFLGAALSRELSKRLKLPQYNTVDDAADLIKRSKNIIVLTGAGISTSLGIPDFRSKDTGLYTKLAHLGLSDPQEVFDIHTFREDPYIFYSIAKDILPDTNRFSPTHAFIRLLQDKGKLLTNYSQNIDNLESKAGILPEKLVQCHGSFATASCVKCHAQVPGEAIYGDLKAGHIPRCQSCVKSLLSVKAANGKRKRKSGHSKERKKRFDGYDTSSEDEGYDVQEAGVMKPDITFFGEALPDTFHDRLTKHDRDLVDLVIVIGTSLKVAPVSEVVPYLPKDIPQMYISRTPVNHVHFDVDMLGDCDVVVAELCRRAGWELKHDMVVPKDVKIEVRLQEGYPSRHTFKVREEEVQNAKLREEEAQAARVREDEIQAAKVREEEIQAAKVREEVQVVKVQEEEVQAVKVQEEAQEKKIPEDVHEEKVRVE